MSQHTKTNEPRSHHDSHTSHDSPQIPVLLYTELYLTWNACVQAGPIAITCTYTICPVTAPHGCGESHAAVLCGACENTRHARTHPVTAPPNLSAGTKVRLTIGCAQRRPMALGDAERSMPMAHRMIPMLPEPRPMAPMAQGPMPERAKPSRSPSWPDDGLSISDGRGDNDSCCKGDGNISDRNSDSRGIGDDGDGSVGKGLNGSDTGAGIVRQGGCKW